MEKEFVETLDITNVHQIRRSEWHIEIHFTIEDFNYLLTMKKIEGTYETGVVYHEDTHVCPVCNVAIKIDTSCRSLHAHRDDLFRRLIEHPSIRLEWLYIPYVEV